MVQARPTTSRDAPMARDWIGPLPGCTIAGTWPTPDHGPYFSLGRWGLLVNIGAVAYGSLVAINIAWPRNAIYNAVGNPHWHGRKRRAERQQQSDHGGTNRSTPARYGHRILRSSVRLLDK